MGDERPDESVDTRIALKRSVGELRQLAVVTGRQVITDLTELFLHNVKIVHQPFGRRRNRPFRTDRLGERAISRQEDTPILLDPWQQSTCRTSFSSNRLRRGETLGMLFQTFDTEKFSA